MVPKESLRKSLEPRIIGQSSPCRQKKQNISANETPSRPTSPPRSGLHLKSNGYLSTSLALPSPSKRWKYLSPHRAMFDHSPTPRGRGYKMWINRVSTPKLPRKPSMTYNEDHQRDYFQDSLDVKEIQWSKERISDEDIDRFVQFSSKNPKRARSVEGLMRKGVDWNDKRQIFKWRLHNIPLTDGDTTLSRSWKNKKMAEVSTRRNRSSSIKNQAVDLPNLTWRPDDIDKFVSKRKSTKVNFSRGSRSRRSSRKSPKRFEVDSLGQRVPTSFSNDKWAEIERQKCMADIDRFEKVTLTEVMRDQFLRSGAAE